MKTIQFETIKVKAEREFVARNGGEHTELIGHEDSSPFLALLAAATGDEPQDPRTVLAEWIDKGRQLIRGWDVRCVKTLIDLFPSSIPRSCRNLSIQIGYDEDDDWAVTFGRTPA